MSAKTLPFSGDLLRSLAEQYPTPFHLYDERGIREGARRLTRAFSWQPGFREFFAVKATPNPHILKILIEEGFGADCSSLAELVLSERVGLRGSDIMFSSNNTPLGEYRKALELGAIVNLDDIGHIPFIEQNLGLPERICFRYNPGAAPSENVIIGDPRLSKFGLTRAQLFDAYDYLKRKGVRRFGLHAMISSNEIVEEALCGNARILLGMAVELSTKLGIQFEFVNVGGGLGLAYRPQEPDVDVERYGRGIQQAYDETIGAARMEPPALFMEHGRWLTGPHGYLVTRCLHLKSTYRNYVGVDACMANLMRPAMYGAHHAITVVGREQEPHDHVCDVVGSLCENNDKFAIDRALPAVEVGDLLVIHDAGAHGHAMGFQYNGKLRSAELLLRSDGRVEQIRRAETLDDYFATLDF